MAFKLTKGQSDAVLMALTWYYTDTINRPLLVVAGLAGSGKSTVVKSMCDAIGVMKSNILYTALTGKAVSVLRMKGHTAATIHRTFYNAKPYKNSVFFSKKQTIPSNIKLIIIDEFGMVGDSLIQDILSFGIPVIGLGDPLQLPPLFEKNSYLTEDTSDIFLTEVMRTDDTSGILDVAMIYRNREIPKPKDYGLSRVLFEKHEIKAMLDYDKVLCWTNKTRRLLNNIIRTELGLFSVYPSKGDIISFLGNRYDKMIEYMGIDICIVNGLECVVLEDAEVINENQIRVKAKPTFVDDDNIFFEVDCNRGPFESYKEFVPDIKTMMNIDRDMELGSLFCDFAWALTVTSSQGSEWGNVLVIDEMPRWRPEYYRFMYTGVTRASKSVDVMLDQ